MKATTTTYRQELATAVLDYATRGWHVFPLRPSSKKPATPDHPAHVCDRTDPRCLDGHTGWEQRATTDPDRIARAWTSRAYGIGIATGPSALVVIDLDIPKDPAHRTGAQRLDELRRRHQHELPTTLVVASPSGGQHLYYAAPAGSAIPNTTSRLGPHIDTRAAGGYIVAPPTRLSGGQRYETLSSIEELPTLPNWIAELLTGPPRRVPRTPKPAGRHWQHGTDLTPSAARYVAAAVAGETDRIRAAAEGTRNNTLFIASVALGQLVGADLISRDLAQGLLLDAATVHVAAGAYSDAQANQTIASGLHRGINQPRQLPRNLTTEANR